MSDATIYDIKTGCRLQETPAAAIPAQQSADILSLCAKFDALQREKSALFVMIPDDDEREFCVDAIEVKQEPLLYRLTELRASTMEEHRARARTLSLYLGEVQLKEDAASDLWPNRLTAAILRDLTADDAPGRDAVLLDLCNQLDADTQALQRYEALPLTPDWQQSDQDSIDVVSDRWHVALAEITVLPALTTAGIRAKAGALGHALRQAIAVEVGLTFEQQAEDYEKLAMSLVRDLAGEVA
jgi:hypothetical protein